MVSGDSVRVERCPNPTGHCPHPADWRLNDSLLYDAAPWTDERVLQRFRPCRNANALVSRLRKRQPWSARTMTCANLPLADAQASSAGRRTVAIAQPAPPDRPALAII